MSAEPEGQTPETKAWVARRDAAARVIASIQADQAAEKVVTDRVIEQEQARNLAPLVVGFVVALVLLLGLGWFLMVRLECDPMWSDRGLSSACRHI